MSWGTASVLALRRSAGTVRKVITGFSNGGLWRCGGIKSSSHSGGPHNGSHLRLKGFSKRALRRLTTDVLGGGIAAGVVLRLFQHLWGQAGVEPLMWELYTLYQTDC